LQIRYKANLQRTEPLIQETIIVLSEFKDLKNWEDIKEKVVNNNLLKKRSSAHLISILNAIKSRFFTENKLPNTEIIADYIMSNVPQSAKNQVIYIYNCYSDALIQKLILDLVKPTLLVSMIRSIVL